MQWLLNLRRAWYSIILRKSFLKPVKNITFKILETKMDTENLRSSGVLVRLNWEGSPSLDVTGYVIKVVDTREDAVNPVLVDQTVGPFSRMWDFGAEQGSILEASVSASDGTFESDKTTANFTVPDLQPPLPVSGVSLSIVGLIDD
tara:strand:+ start:173 stop:610 length:438 start_codon:yes stop_codon:yes gene_type:complete